MRILSCSGLNAFRLASLVMLAIFGACNALEPRESETVYDLVILHGRVMDPATGLDGIRALGITGGVIREVTEKDLQGRETLDARGMVVAPGFIDLHQHAQDPAGYRVEVLDGTTTALELEGGTDDIERAGTARTRCPWGSGFIRSGIGRSQEKLMTYACGCRG